MKAIKNFIRIHRFFTFTLFTLVFASLMFVSCEKEKIVEIPVVTTVRDTIEVPVVTDPGGNCDLPHEVEDLVAWYSPVSNILFVHPGYLENVLQTLQAQPSSLNGYSMNGINLYGEPRPVHFQVELKPSPEIFAQATATEAQLTPDLIQTFTEKGTSYKVYKNAECGKLQKGFESLCEGNADGTSTKRTWYEIRRCERGNGFCTEAMGLHGKSVTYHNGNCQGPAKSETSIMGYACW
jgi:hypothetical protein